MKKLIDTNEWYARVYVSMPLLKEKENAGYDLNLGAVVLNCEGRTFVLDSYETRFTSEAEEGEDFELCSKLEIDLDTFPVDKEFNDRVFTLILLALHTVQSLAQGSLPIKFALNTLL